MDELKLLKIKAEVLKIGEQVQSVINGKADVSLYLLALRLQKLKQAVLDDLKNPRDN